jgi:hypothetical protein
LGGLGEKVRYFAHLGAAAGLNNDRVSRFDVRMTAGIKVIYFANFLKSYTNNFSCHTIILREKAITCQPMAGNEGLGDFKTRQF